MASPSHCEVCKNLSFTSIRRQTEGIRTLISQNENHNHRKPTKMITWIIALCNSVKLRNMLYRVTKNGWVMVERSDKMGPIGEGNGKPLQYSCIQNPMNCMKSQKRKEKKKKKHLTAEDEPPKLVGVSYTTGKEWRSSSR